MSTTCRHAASRVYSTTMRTHRRRLNLVSTSRSGPVNHGRLAPGPNESHIRLGRVCRPRLPPSAAWPQDQVSLCPSATGGSAPPRPVPAGKDPSKGHGKALRLLAAQGTPRQSSRWALDLHRESHCVASQQRHARLTKNISENKVHATQCTGTRPEIEGTVRNRTCELQQA